MALCFFPAFKISERATAILWRTSAGTANANGMEFLRGRVDRFNADLVLPMIPHVMDAGEPFIHAEIEFQQGHIRIRGMQLE